MGFRLADHPSNNLVESYLAFLYSARLHCSLSQYVCVCVCIPILVTTFPEWLSGTEPLPHTPGAVCPSPLCFVVFCVHMHSFAGLIRRTPPPTFSDTAITDRHSDTAIFPLRAQWVRISWSIGSENRSDMCPQWESNPRLPACKASTLYTRPGSPLSIALTVMKYFIVRNRYQLLTQFHYSKRP